MSVRHIVSSAIGLALATSCYSAASASSLPLLGATAATFAVLGGAGGITSSGATTINGNVGAAPTNTIVGFPPALITGGGLTTTAMAQQARDDALVAYNFLALQSPTQNLTGTDLGGLTLTPGVYRFSSSAQLTGALTLNAQGADNAVFIFEIDGSLTTANSAAVYVINGGPSDGVFWQVGGSATLGNDTQFEGNILANTSITLNPFASIGCGRALAGINAASGAVTMANANNVAIDAGSGCVGGYGGGYQSTADGGFQLIGGEVIGGGSTNVPEPASLALLFGASLSGLLIARRRVRAPATIT